MRHRSRGREREGRATAHAPSLDDRYVLDEGRVLLTGIQALVRLPLDQHRADRRAGPAHRRRSSPATRARRSAASTASSRATRAAAAAEHRRRPRPGLNEELGATAVWGSQLAPALPERALRRRARRLVRQGARRRPRRPTRSATATSSAPTRSGGVLALCGDDPSVQVLDAPERVRGAARRAARCRSSTRQRAGGARPRPARDRAVARVRPVGGAQDRHRRRRRDRHRRGRARPRHARSLPVLERRAARTCTVPYGAPARARVARDGAHADAARAGARAALRARERAQPRSTRDARRRVARHRRRRQAPTTTCAQALDDLGLDDASSRAPASGSSSSGCSTRSSRESLREFARGPRRDPRGRGEAARSSSACVKDALYGLAERAARRRQARRARRSRCCRPDGELDADAIARAVARAAARGARSTRVEARLEQLDAVARAARSRCRRRARTPFFCSGCPHNRSTDGARRRARRRRHRLPHDGRCSNPEGKGDGHRHHPDGRRGRAVDRHGAVHRAAHIFQNLGDGTFHHSGSLAIRAAVAAGREHHLQAALQRRRRDDRRPGTSRAAMRVPELDPAARGRGREADRSSPPTTPSATAAVELAAHRRGARPRASCSQAQDELAAVAGRHRADPRPGVRGREAPRCASAASWPTRRSGS